MDTFEDMNLALACVRAFGGHSLAYSVLQPGMRYFGSAACGCVAYRRWLGQTCVLGDPLVASGAVPGLIAAFLARFPRAMFMQIHADTAALLHRLGYRVTPVGVECELDTATFSLVGKRKQDLRHYRNKALKAGVRVVELEDTVSLRAALRPVSDAWLPSKSWFAHELEFLARPFQPEPEPGVRIFVVYDGARPVAFSVLDPMYRDGVVKGYTVSILRHTQDAPEGACDFINLHALALLRDEGIPLLSLGVSPFHRLEELADTEGHGAWPVYLVYRALRRFGDPIYHFHGLSFHKGRYRAHEVPVYTAVRGPIGLLPLYASAKVCRMV